MTCSLILRLGISLFGLTRLHRVVLITASCVLYALGMDLKKRVYAPIGTEQRRLAVVELIILDCLA
jgi:hypothetical protein